ncbi:MAG: hypothetical protein R2815_05075 [Flavobacteriales bacterium]|nr:hypothetical protein [Flavobacteriales bacterium]
MRGSILRSGWVLATIAALLFATSGIGIVRMTCMVSGNSVLSIGSSADCCPMDEKAPAGTVREECCDVTVLHTGTEPFLAHEHHQFVPGPMAQVPSQWPILQLGRPHELQQWTHPPPLDVGDRLAVICRYSI